MILDIIMMQHTFVVELNLYPGLQVQESGIKFVGEQF